MNFYPSFIQRKSGAKRCGLGTVFGLTVAALVPAPDALGEEPTPVDAAQQGELISLFDAAPSIYASFRRYPKYYGDPNMNRETIDGPIFERQYLLGSMGGFRDTALRNGFTLDFDVTQVYQGTVSGPGDGGRYTGSADLYISLDTARAGLWSGGMINAHLEGNWGKTVDGTGALLPLNADSIMPAAPSEFALSELYIVQALPNNFSLIGGKINFGDNADKSPFANDERNEFLYEGLNNNALYGAFLPYTSLGGALAYQINPELDIFVAALSNNTDALSAGFDDLSWDTMTYATGMDWNTSFNGLPGAYSFLLGYTVKDTLAFDVDERYLVGELLGDVPPATKDDNYGFTLTASQYLWADQSARRSDGQVVGIGPFFRFGIGPDDRNLIDQFYSVGVGGVGGPFGRHDDNWGIGWAGTHFSDDLRDDADVLGIDIDKFEHVFEGYYNVALTPAIRTSFHVQYINSANPTLDDAVVLATRLQLDF